MITVGDLTKRFGSKLAVDHLGFEVRPGVVTGFLGPNGSGKSTTMRCMLDLDRSQSGTTLFDGRPYRSLHRPLHEFLHERGIWRGRRGCHPLPRGQVR